MSQSRKGLLLVLISSVVFGTIPGAVTYCTSQGANATIILVVRYAILSLLLLPSVLRTENIRAIYKRHRWQLASLSAFCTITPILLFASYTRISTSSASALHFMYPVVVVLICVLIFHDKISKLKLVCLALCFGGAFLMLDASGGIDPLGAALALVSALAWGSYIVGVDKYNFSDLPGQQMIFFVETGNLILITFLYGIPTGTLTPDITAIGWVAVIVSNAIAAVGGTMFFTIGVRYTNAQVSAIASTLEPITCILVGVLILNEPFTPRSMAGTVMILAAVVLLSVFGTHEDAAATE